ncbi:threonine ammonia-lyase IlvA [Jannaschia sp. Os4]|uniref:threonine ammonia-lyase IlvA n=1 Tax=Jannaschia sp. Os4 TaxID=2807617 RepID=UPI001939B4A1|nr:threonine ammonia-lyase IlvA [Jannaschia sp. Os4]MBM2575269.1 threonine ammonia-lyase IlvA [Jannaschia sp. Os4]
MTGGFADRARAAEAALRDLFAPTPLQRNDWLSDRHGADVWLKREDLTPVRSYKLRGAFNAMRGLAGDRPVGAASAGNHAQGVAWMCRRLDRPGTIFMPVTTPGQKVDKTRAFGGGRVTIRLVGDTFDDCLAAAQDWCAEAGAAFLSPFDDDAVIEGQATVAVELLEQMPDLGAADLMVLPVGGGGLSAGMRALLRAEGRLPEMRLVEPAGGASLAAALAAGGPVTLDRLDTFVDGAAVARVGARPFAALADVDPAHVAAVPEDRVCITLQELLNVEGIVLEPAGALSVDALRDLDVAGRRVVCVTTGGNFDFERLPDVKERAMRFAGLKKYLVVRMPQRPGALRDFLDLLGPSDDIARFEYLKKSTRNFGSVLLGIETDDPANFPALTGRMDAKGFGWRDITHVADLAELVI